MVRLKNKVTMLVLSALTLQMTQAVIIVNGPTGATAGQTSNEPFTTLKIHKESGTLVLTTSGGNSNNSVMLIARPTTTDVAPTATGIAADTNLRNANITLSAIVPNLTTPTNANTIQIGLVKETISAYNTAAVYLLTPTAGTAVVKTPLDAEGTPAANATVCGLTGGNTPSVSCLFAAVKKNGAAATSFAMSTTGDGVAVLTIDNSTLAMTQVNSAAYALDIRSTGSLSCGDTGATATTNIAAGTEIPMAYDADLSVLYVGMPNITTNNLSAHRTTAGAYSIAMFYVTPGTGALTQMSPVHTGNMTTVLGAASGQYIIGQRGANKTITANKLAIMTTSDGPSASYRFKYLIVNGVNGAITTTGNQIWAIPLVVGNADTTQNGAFAAVTTGNFATPAAALGDLYLTTSAAAKVGNGPLPIAAAATDVQDIKIVGDAVYVSVATTGSATSTPGVYTSQAIFDNLGKVAGWTEWHKIVPNALTASATTGRAGLISVDAVTGHISVADNANDGSTAYNVRMTQWQNTSYNATTNPGTPNPKGLITNLNSTGNVGNGCTAVCDLNSTTTAWGNVTPARMALFGGINGKVCFAMTGSARVASSAALVSTNTGYAWNFDTDSDTTALDYTSSNTLLLTQLPTGAGTVRSLSHSGWYPVSGSITPGFFFAGAETGNGEGALYVYCAATLGVGYNQRNIKNFGVAPFRTYSWQQLTGCDGIPVKIQAQGGAVYILTRKVDNTGASTDRIFRLIKKQTGAALNTSFIVTATAGAVAGNVNLSSVNHIYDFVVSQTGAGSEQLTMLTNDGVYTTTASLGCDSATYNNAANNGMLYCGWEKVTSPATMEGFMLKFFSQSNTRDPQTLWSAQWIPASDTSSIYDTMSLVQYGRATNSFQPFGQDQMINFNAYDGTTTVPAGFTNLPVVTNFYSDGGRRLFSSIVRSSSSSLMKLTSVPYRVDAWNLQQPYTLQDAAIQNLGAVYWMLPIAGTYMVGTSKGVVALQ